MAIADAIPEALRTLTIVRTFGAPRALVFRVWTDPARLAAWWGPKSFTMDKVQVAVRPGGAIHMVMRARGGSAFPFDGR